MHASDDLDPAAIERLHRLGGAKFTGEMIRLFLSYGGEKLLEARAALTAGDLGGVEKAVHPLKSSAGNVGAERLRQLAVEAEQRAKEGQRAAVADLMARLEHAFEAVKPLLEAQQQTESSSDPTNG